MSFKIRRAIHTGFDYAGFLTMEAGMILFGCHKAGWFLRAVCLVLLLIWPLSAIIAMIFGTLRELDNKKS